MATKILLLSLLTAHIQAIQNEASSNQQIHPSQPIYSSNFHNNSGFTPSVFNGVDMLKANEGYEAHFVDGQEVLSNNGNNNVGVVTTKRKKIKKVRVPNGNSQSFNSSNGGNNDWLQQQQQFPQQQFLQAQPHPISPLKKLAGLFRRRVVGQQQGQWGQQMQGQQGQQVSGSASIGNYVPALNGGYGPPPPFFGSPAGRRPLPLPQSQGQWQQGQQQQQWHGNNGNVPNNGQNNQNPNNHPQFPQQHPHPHPQYQRIPIPIPIPQQQQNQNQSPYQQNNHPQQQQNNNQQPYQQQQHNQNPQPYQQNNNQQNNQFPYQQNPHFLTKLKKSYVSTFHNLFGHNNNNRRLPQQPYFQNPSFFHNNTNIQQNQNQQITSESTARRRKIKLRKPNAELIGRPRMDVEGQGGEQQEGHEEQEKEAIETPETVNNRKKRSNSGYRMPGLYGMEGGAAFYGDKDPTTGDLTFNTSSPVKMITSYSSAKSVGVYTSKLQRNSSYTSNKLKNKRPTFYKFNKVTMAPPKLPSFYSTKKSVDVETTTEAVATTEEVPKVYFVPSRGIVEVSTTTTTQPKIETKTEISSSMSQSVSSSSSSSFSSSSSREKGKKPIFTKNSSSSSSRESGEKVGVVKTRRPIIFRTTAPTTVSTTITTPVTTTTTVATTTTESTTTETTTPMTTTLASTTSSYDPYLPYELLHAMREEKEKESNSMETKKSSINVLIDRVEEEGTTVAEQTTTLATTTTTTPMPTTTTLKPTTTPISITTPPPNPTNSNPSSEEDLSDYYYDNGGYFYNQYLHPSLPVPPGRQPILQPQQQNQNQNQNHSDSLAVETINQKNNATSPRPLSNFYRPMVPPGPMPPHFLRPRPVPPFFGGGRPPLNEIFVRRPNIPNIPVVSYTPSSSQGSGGNNGNVEGWVGEVDVWSTTTTKAPTTVIVTTPPSTITTTTTSTTTTPTTTTKTTPPSTTITTTSIRTTSPVSTTTTPTTTTTTTTSSPHDYIYEYIEEPITDQPRPINPTTNQNPQISQNVADFLASNEITEQIQNKSSPMATEEIKFTNNFKTPPPVYQIQPNLINPPILNQQNNFNNHGQQNVFNNLGQRNQFPQQQQRPTTTTTAQPEYEYEYVDEIVNATKEILPNVNPIIKSKETEINTNINAEKDSPQTVMMPPGPFIRGPPPPLLQQQGPPLQYGPPPQNPLTFLSNLFNIQKKPQNQNHNNNQMSMSQQIQKFIRPHHFHGNNNNNNNFHGIARNGSVEEWGEAPIVKITTPPTITMATPPITTKTTPPISTTTTIPPQTNQEDSEEVIYVTQDELDRLKASGKLDGEYEVEGEVVATAAKGGAVSVPKVSMVPQKGSSEEYEYYDEEENNATISTTTTTLKPMTIKTTTSIPQMTPFTYKDLTLNQQNIVTNTIRPGFYDNNNNNFNNYVSPSVFPQQQFSTVATHFQGGQKVPQQPVNYQQSPQQQQNQNQQIHYDFRPIISPQPPSSNYLQQRSSGGGVVVDYEDLVTAGPDNKPFIKNVVVKGSFNSG